MWDMYGCVDGAETSSMAWDGTGQWADNSNQVPDARCRWNNDHTPQMVVVVIVVVVVEGVGGMIWMLH
jgi:hypothetical protein